MIFSVSLVGYGMARVESQCFEYPSVKCNRQGPTPFFMGVGKMDVPLFFGGRSTIHKLYTLSYTYLLHVLVFN